MGACFAHCRWIPGGWLSRRLRCWSASARLEDQVVTCIWFSCNFVGVACMRTLHFQYAVWYFHTLPFLAWFAVRPDAHQGLGWALRCGFVAALVLAVELAYLRTTHGQVEGPDGRTWQTTGVPTRSGSLLLQAAHWVLLV